jgi:MFS family permease
VPAAREGVREPLMLAVARQRYVLGLLTLIYMMNILDRGLIVLLLQPIKQDLRLSDTQLGFVTGIAFALFYSTLGVPIARWADRGNRVTITSVAIGLWSLTVMSCLLVTNFVQLVVARIAAAIGESGCMPPTYSLLGDYFPHPGERTQAMAIYSMAGPFAALVSFMLGGWLNEIYGWRLTFFVLGLLAALLVKWTIPEPRLEARDARVKKPASRPLIAVLRGLWRQQSSRNLCVAFVLLYTMGSGLGPWYAAFMMRSHGIGTAELGVWFGLMFGICQLVGILFGGYLGGRWLPDNERGQMRISAVFVALVTPFCALFLLVHGKHQALIALAPLIIVWSIFLGPAFALMQRLVVDEARATALAVVMLFSNLIGAGVGPQLVGWLSDLFKPYLGVDSLRCAMLTMSSIAPWAAFHLWRVGRTVKTDLAAVPHPAQPDMRDEGLA